MELKNRYEKVKGELEKTCSEMACVNHTDTKLIAVSKKFSTEKIEELFNFGQINFAENYVNEFTEKVEKLKHLGIAWHFIGHLQTNKVNKVVGLADYIHSVDSEKLLKKIISECKKKVVQQKVLLQVKFGDEESKRGFEIDQIENIISEYISDSRVSICGLMCILPLNINDLEKKKFFLLLQKKFETLKLNLNLPTQFRELSMGMSDDFRLAISAGSTMIRVGTAIFGARQ